MMLTVVLLLVGGLSIDLWRAFSERRAIAEMAESSARAGANGIDLEMFDLTGEVLLDPTIARQLAADNLSEQTNLRFVTGSSIDADTDTVVVDIRATVPMTLLGMVGIGELDIAVSSEAEPRLEG